MSGSDAGGGLRVSLDAATSALSDLVSRLEPGCLTGADVKELYGAVVVAERFCVAAKTLLAPRIDASMVWAEQGHPNAASLMAALEGIPLGQARSTLELGRNLDQLPDTEEAVRSGRLSRPKAAEVVGAALLDPESEGDLLAGADELPLHKVKERCQRSRAASAHHDPVAAIKRAHANRSFSSWSDPDGTFCYKGTDTADRGAQILNRINSMADGVRRERRAQAKAIPAWPAMTPGPTSPSGHSELMRSLPSSPGPVPALVPGHHQGRRQGQRSQVAAPSRTGRPRTPMSIRIPSTSTSVPSTSPAATRASRATHPRLVFADRSAPNLLGDGPGRPGRPAAGGDPPRGDL